MGVAPRFVLALCWFALPVTALGDNLLGLELSPSGPHFDLTVNGTAWLRSAEPFLYRAGERLTLDNNGLVLLDATHMESFDSIGRFKRMKYHIRTNESTDYVEFKWNVQNYSKGFADTLVVFDQIYLNGVNDTGAPPEVKTLAGWPGFDRTLPLSLDLGFLTFAGGMLGSENLTLGRWSDLDVALPDGLEGSGPLCLFDTEGNAMVISALTHLMATNSWREQGQGKDSLYWGIMQGVPDLPRDFTHRTMLYYSPYGINQAFQGWGSVLRKYYGKPDVPQSRQDVTLQFLGYDTDYGSYYYQNPPPGKTWQGLLEEIKEKLKTKGIPISYFQLDDWWYTKDLREAVIRWSPSTAAFPGGIESLYNSTSCAVVARGGVWSLQNEYDRANGGQFHFVRESEMSLPDDQNFWNFLLNKSHWGLHTYEQGNMKEQMLGITELTRDMDLGRRWLTQMGTAAADNSVEIMYSDALPRQALQSVEVPAVTQARVSGDYHRQRDQWRIGVTSMLAWALGLAPSKDVFWASRSQPGNPLYHEELYPDLQGVVATLSAGPVAIGDNPDVITSADQDVLQRCCRSDGLVLRPAHPATAINSQIMQMALGGELGPRGEVWTSITGELSILAFGLVLAVNLTAPLTLTPTLAFHNRFPGGKIFPMETPVVLTNFTDDSPFTIPACALTPSQHFCLFGVSPVITVGDHELVLLGDLSKWVPMSSRRFRGMSQGGRSSFQVILAGAPGERFLFHYALDGEVLNQTVHMPENSSDADRVRLELLPQPPTSPRPSTPSPTPPPTTSPMTSQSPPRQNVTSGPTDGAQAAHARVAFLVVLGLAAQFVTTAFL